ncbi:MAG: general secretion pathway protein GspB [Ramlibacter sp.]
MRVIPSTLLALVAAVAAATPALSQVRPAEPFGGRPFGAPPGTPPADTGTNGSTMGAPGTSSVNAPGTPNMGTPPSVVIAPVQVAAPPPPPPPPPPAAPTPTPMQQSGPVNAQGAPANGGVQSSPVTPMPSGPTTSSVPAPAAASIAQPFGGVNRNAPAPAPATASTAQQPPVRGLPSDAPKLVISGSVYSPDPAKRILIVNGQMMREGADLGQGVVLQEVRQEGAVLGFKGNNYTVVF